LSIFCGGQLVMEDKIFKTNAEIEAAKAANYTEFGKLNLGYIREGIMNILKLIGRNGIFNEYTLHDETHINAMLELLDKIIPPETTQIMTKADWLLIVLACYFHDLGLLVTNNEYENRGKSKFYEFRDEKLLKGDIGVDYKASLSHLSKEEIERFYYQEFVRNNHAERIYHWVTGHAQVELGASHKAVDVINNLLNGLDNKLRRDLALICRSHHRDDLDQIDTVYVLRRAYGQSSQTHANLQYIALLLRTADLLQIQRNRVPSIMYKLINPANPKSQDEWAKQARVRAVLKAKSKTKDDQNYDTIEVQAEFDQASGFFGLIAYLQYARNELKRSEEWAELAKENGSKHEFPWRYINDNQVEAIGFLPQRYQFILDREKILSLLTGHTLYNDTSVAIREILQNAIDAIRFQHYTHQDEKIGEVKVKWNTETRRIVVEDNGVGMTRNTIENHLLNIGASYYQERKFKEKYPDFSPISRFGIGVLSYFMISNDVEILTFHQDEEVAYKLTLPSVTQRYLIKLIPKDNPEVKSVGNHGTRVSLVVRPSATIDDIEKILRYWIVLPRCPVLLEIDEQETKTIGFSSTEKALEFYVKQSLPNVEKMQDIKIRKNEPKEGIDLSYATRFSHWFKIWEILTRDSYTFEEKFKDSFSKPPGVCVEGIRISSNPPGYNQRGIWAIADLSGPNSPRSVSEYSLSKYISLWQQRT